MLSKKKKPSIHNYVLAHTAIICAGIGVSVVLGWMYYALYAAGVFGIDWLVVTQTVIICTPLSVMLGLMIGVFLLWHISGIGKFVSWIQGAPFRMGDSVWILSGKYKNTLAQVYDVWTERGQVRVDLGREARKTYEDVFCTVEICRAKDVD